jgi:gamma-glutamyltranspeptidase / glutathione hydrolase
MLTRSTDDSLVAALGVMGGSMQPQGHLQVMLHLLLDDMDPQEALDAPRFCLDIESPDGRVWVEEGMPTDTIRELNARGHRVELLTGYKRSIFGRGQVIRILNDGSRTAGSDHRADGCALPE